MAHVIKTYELFFFKTPQFHSLVVLPWGKNCYQKASWIQLLWLSSPLAHVSVGPFLRKGRFNHYHHSLIIFWSDYTMYTWYHLGVIFEKIWNIQLAWKVTTRFLVGMYFRGCITTHSNHLVPTFNFLLSSIQHASFDVYIFICAWNLRCSVMVLLYGLPPKEIRLVRMQDRTFPAIAPTLWNHLSREVSFSLCWASNWNLK